MADTKSTSKKSSVNPLVAIGLGCLVLLVLIGVGITIATRFFAKQIGTSFVQSVIENKTGIKTNLQDIEKGKMSFTDPKTGESINIGTGKLPENFPSDFPVYPGATVESSLTGNQTGSANGIWVTFTSPDKMEKIADFYKTQLKNKGWTQTGTMDVGTVVTYTVEKGNLEGTVAINSENKDKTGILVTLGTKESSNNQNETEPEVMQ
jgi:hypothetical protein